MFLIILIIIVVLLVILSSLFVHVRYEPLYKVLNRKRDYYNFRSRCFFEEKFWDKVVNNNTEPGFKIVTSYNVDKTHTNIISYSLYGTANKYFNKIENNIDIVRTNLPLWKVRVYIHDKVAKEIVDRLISTGSQVFIVTDSMVKPGNSAGAFWRFLPLVEDMNVVVLDIDDGISVYIPKIQKFFENEEKPYISTVWKSPWPIQHVQAKLIFKKSVLTLPFKADTIMTYPHRSTFGSDEIFLSTTLGVFLLEQNKSDSTVWIRDLPWYSIFMRKSKI